eukprot:gene8631-6062_t
MSAPENGAKGRGGTLRALSYNLTAPPIGYSAYQHERINTFVSLVDGYDVLLLQGVYPSSILPYAVQRFFCSQSRLLDGLREKGFHQYVISRQPSYQTMLQYNIFSNSGLVIASRFPIYRHGSYTFRSSVRGAEGSVTYGCLFAEVEVPGANGAPGGRIVVFDVHLNPSAITLPTASFHVHEARQFVRAVLNQLATGDDGWKDGADDGKRPAWLPFVVAGDFNVPGVDPTSLKCSKELSSLLHEFDILRDMQNILFEPQMPLHLGGGQAASIPCTRTPQPIFSAESALEDLDAMPLRQDYFFVSEGLEVSEPRIEKFVVGRRPYVYLSDHYGIAATLHVAPPASTDAVQEKTKPKATRIHPSALVEEALRDNAVPTRSILNFTLIILMAAAGIAFFVSWRLLFAAVLCPLGVALGVRRSVVPVPLVAPFAEVNEGVIAGRSTVAVRQPLERNPLVYHDATLAVGWERALKRFITLPCLLTLGAVERVSILSYDAVNERARLLCRGLLSIGLAPGEKIGIQCDACGDALLLDIVCLQYGFATVSLAGRGAIVRGVLDHNHIRVVCSTPSNIYDLLSSRSTSLETLVCLNGFPLEADVAMANDLNITILSSTSIQEMGRGYTAMVQPLQATSATVWTYTMNSIATSGFTTLTPVTHGDAIRDLEALQLSGVLPQHSVVYRSETERFVWYAPFESLFPRLCAIGIFLTGGSVVAADPSQIEEACRTTHPSLFVAEPALFRLSMTQMRRLDKTYRRIYRCFSHRVYALCSSLIHSKHTDCPMLRRLFFASQQQQLGDGVRRIVLHTPQETTAFDLLEYITVAYVPSVREVVFLNHLGVCSIDGIPAPGVRVRLEPMDDLSADSSIGRVCITRSGEAEEKLEIAGRWEENRRLTLLDAVEGILWPVDYHYGIAVELERTFRQSRYVNDVFIFCETLQSLIAVVYPNKDTLEFAWRQAFPGRDAPFGWKELVAFSTDVILDDLRAIGKRSHIHHSQIPKFIHLHPPRVPRPHQLREPLWETLPTEDDFVLRDLLQQDLQRIPPIPPRDSAFPESFSDTDATAYDASRESAGITVPFTVDIGGTFAKIAYVMPPGMKDVHMPEFMTQEASSLTKTLGIRVFDFFDDRAAAERELVENPASPVGTVRFMKVPTRRVADLAELVKSVGVLGYYKPEFSRKIRATGGGAFKYSHIARHVLNAKFDVVKEMDAVVKGLNLVLEMAPSSIFTVNTETGERLPHKLHSPGSSFSPFPYLLINIGSGISFIKCTGPDGAHVRVGGSPIGGATFWGLTRMLTNLTSWEEVLEIMRLDGPGDNKNVDLLVGDIYGYNAKDLPAMLSCETVASSFGKMGVERAPHPHMHSRNNSLSELESVGSLAVDGSTQASFSPTQEHGPPATPSMDIVRSLLNLLSGNVTQLAYLHSRLHGVRNVFFVGGFVRENHILWSHISQTMQYWSSGECFAHFLEHDGYLGALGCTIIDGPGTSPLEPSESGGS